jgi:hypothetical protein
MLYTSCKFYLKREKINIKLSINLKLRTKVFMENNILLKCI